MADVILAFYISSAILFLGFAGNILFKKTGFPDILYMMALGLLVGPLLGVFSAVDLIPIMPFITTLTLMMILFNGGLELPLEKVLSQSLRATILAMLYFLFVTFAVAAFFHYLFEIRWLLSLMFGPMIAGTSSVVIIPLSKKLGLTEETSTTIALESTLTDVLNIVFLFVLLDLYFTGATSFQIAFGEVASKVSVGLVIGLIVGVVWLRVLQSVRGQEYTYMLTLAALIGSYVASESLNGSGVLTALVFGLVLGNDDEFIRFFRMKIDQKTLERLKPSIFHFQAELSFILRSFFFVFLGLIYSVRGVPLFVVLIIPLAIFGINIGLRYLATYLSTLKSGMAEERKAITLLCGQGLAHATLSVIPLQFGLPNASLYLTVVINVILITNIATSISALVIKRGNMRHHRRRDIQ